MNREPTNPNRWSVSRRFVTAAAVTVAALVAAHGLSALLRTLTATPPPLAAVELTLGAVAATLVGCTLLPRRAAPAAAALAGALAAVLALVAEPGAWTVVPVLPAVGAAAVPAARWFGGRLPSEIDGALTRRRALAVAWALLALVAVVQTGRLATHVTDPGVELVIGTAHPFWNGHHCYPAYLHGAELALWGEENLYAQEHYLGHAEDPRTEVEGLGVEDPYQYPPQFLLLPALALQLTHDPTLLRVGWFVLNAALFVLTYTLLALWVGRRPGRLALWLLPAVLASFPVLYNFQYGQFHLATLCLAVLGMLAFARRWRVAGGFLLAAAILAKLFPAVLLAPLAARRRVRELAWTAAWGVALTALALAVFGPAPFTAFFQHHLPQLSSGAAFAFDELFPSLADLVIADNQGVFGLAVKLGATKAAAAAINRAFTVGVLLLAAVAGLRFAGAGRWARGSLWLALLGLGSLASPGAWGDYVPVVAVWLLALVAARALERRWLRWPLAVVAAFQVLLLGTMPVAGWGPPEVMIPVSALGVVTLLALFASVALSQPHGWRRSSVGSEPREEAEPLERAA